QPRTVLRKLRPAGSPALRPVKGSSAGSVAPALSTFRVATPVDSEPGYGNSSRSPNERLRLRLRLRVGSDGDELHLKLSLDLSECALLRPRSSGNGGALPRRHFGRRSLDPIP